MFSKALERSSRLLKEAGRGENMFIGNGYYWFYFVTRRRGKFLLSNEWKQVCILKYFYLVFWRRLFWFDFYQLFCTFNRMETLMWKRFNVFSRKLRHAGVKQSAVGVKEVNNKSSNLFLISCLHEMLFYLHSERQWFFLEKMTSSRADLEWYCPK